MEVIKRLAASRRFWLAMVAVGQSIVFGLWPNFPVAIWQSINVLLGVLIAAISIDDATANLSGK